MSVETFIENINQSHKTTITTGKTHIEALLTLDEVFPIINDESLNNFECKIKTNKDFRSNVVC